MANRNSVHRLTRLEAQRVWIADHQKRGMTVIHNMLHQVTGGGGEYLLSTGAKLYRIPNGGSKPFAIIGYAWDDHDATEALNLAIRS